MEEGRCWLTLAVVKWIEQGREEVESLVQQGHRRGEAYSQQVQKSSNDGNSDRR